MALSTEQIRTLLSDRLAEYEAFKYMDEVLSKVQESEREVKDAKKELAKIHQDILGKEEALAALDRKATERKEALEAEYASKESALQAKLDDVQKEHARKAAGLKEYQGQLDKIEENHKTALATWQDRVQQARTEFAAITAKHAAVQQQMDALMSMVGGKR